MNSIGAADAQIDAGLLRIWQVMQDCVKRGCRTDGMYFPVASR